MASKGSISLWDRSAPEPAPALPFAGTGDCDLAIVGGGYTGLSTALHGAERGLDCHVLEAGQLGQGGSGRNVGLVNAGLWLPPQEVVARLGPEAGAALNARMGQMPAAVFELIERHQIQCEVTRSGTIHAAHSATGLADLARRAAQWQALGAPVELLDATATAEKTGTRAFHGGLLDRRAGTINPMGYVRGLARAARGAGARISTGVRVTGLARHGDRWTVETAAGMLRAKYVVIATNAYADDLWPGLRQSFTPIRFFQVATEPLVARAGHILAERQGLWDTGPIMFSLRRDSAGRLILGSMGALQGGLSRLWARRQLARLFPELGPVQLETAWQGRIALTDDHLFRIHQPAPGLYVPTGYNGRGITTGTMFGQALAAVLTGAPPDSLPLPITGLRPARFRAVRALACRAAFAANQLLKSL